MGRRTIGDTKMTGAQRTRRWRGKNSAEAIPSAKLVLPDLISGADVQQCFQTAMHRSQSKSCLKMPLKKRCNLFAKEIHNHFKAVNEPKPYNDFANALKDARLFLDNVHIPLTLIEVYLENSYVPMKKGRDCSVSYKAKQNLLVQRKNFKRAAKALQTLVDQHIMKDWEGPLWVWLSIHIAIDAIDAWSEVGRPPKAVNHNSPICIFVAEVLGFLGIQKKPAAVSEVLRGRRHRNFFMPLKQIWANRLAEIAHMANS